MVLRQAKLIKEFSNPKQGMELALCMAVDDLTLISYTCFALEDLIMSYSIEGDLGAAFDSIVAYADNLEVSLQELLAAEASDEYTYDLSAVQNRTSLEDMVANSVKLSEPTAGRSEKELELTEHKELYDTILQELINASEKF